MNALFTFEAAARSGSFSRASEELNVTPAAVSRMIARLEGHLGCGLFLRGPGGVTLSDDGQLLFDAVSRSFAGVDAALQEIERRKTGSQTVTISVSTGFTTHWMMPRMSAFKRAFPDVDLRFQLTMGPVSGPVNDVDFGWRFDEGNDTRHDAIFVMPELLIPICSPAYLVQAEETLITLSEGQPNTGDLFFPHDPVMANSLIFSDYAIVVQAAMLGQGIALGWLNVVSHWLCTGALVPARRQAMRTRRQAYFVQLRGKPQRPAVTAVRDWLHEELLSDAQNVDRMYPELGLAGYFGGEIRC